MNLVRNISRNSLGASNQLGQPFIANSLIHLELSRFEDFRGFFAETYSRRQYAELGINSEFVQDNHSLSRDFGTLRGLHFQAPPHAQVKLIRCG